MTSKHYEKQSGIGYGGSYGIGRETALAFAKKGHDMVISDIKETQFKETERLLKGEGIEVLSVKADISEEQGVRNMIEKISKKFGQLDIACNNAGIGGESATTGKYSTEGWDQVLNINLKGQFIWMKYEIEAMLENGEGSIINVSSILGLVGFAEAPAEVAAAIVWLASDEASFITGHPLLVDGRWHDRPGWKVAIAHSECSG